MEESIVKILNIDDILPNPHQPRRIFEPLSLVELSNSIAQYGVMQPITVRKLGSDLYELVAGERRLRASKLANIQTIPAIITDISETSSAVLAMVENLQRSDLNFLEEAAGIARLINDHNFTQEDLVKKLGRTQSTIANKLRLLRLPSSVCSEIIQNNLSERHARALLRLEQDDKEETESIMLEVLQKIVQNNLTVTKTDALIDSMLNNKKKPNKNPIKIYDKNLKVFTHTIKSAVETIAFSGMDTKYDVVEREDGMDITISVNY